MFTHGPGLAPEVRHSLHSHHQPHAKDVQRKVGQVQAKGGFEQVCVGLLFINSRKGGLSFKV